jgi:hypothetical protein
MGICSSQESTIQSIDTPTTPSRTVKETVKGPQEKTRQNLLYFLSEKSGKSIGEVHNLIQTDQKEALELLGEGGTISKDNFDLLIETCAHEFALKHNVDEKSLDVEAVTKKYKTMSTNQFKSTFGNWNLWNSSINTIPSDIPANHLFLLSITCPLQDTDFKELFRATTVGWAFSQLSNIAKYPTSTLLSINGQIAPTPKPWVHGIDYETRLSQKIQCYIYVKEPWNTRKEGFGNHVTFIAVLPDETFIQTSLPLDPKIYFTNGIAVGPQTASKAYRFKVEKGLQTGIWQFDALSGGSHSLTPCPTNFYYTIDINDIVVYALGTELDYSRYEKAMTFEKTEAQKRAEVKVRNADGKVDRELLVMAGLVPDLDAMGIVKTETAQEKARREARE